MADTNDVPSNYFPPVTPHNNARWIRYREIKKAFQDMQNEKTTTDVPALLLPVGDDPATRSPEQPVRAYISVSTQTTPSLTKCVGPGPVIKTEDDCFTVAESAFDRFPEESELFQTPSSNRQRQITDSPGDYSQLMPGAYPATPSIIEPFQRDDSVHTPTPAQRPRPRVSPTPLLPGYYPVSPSPPKIGSLFGMGPSSPVNWSDSEDDIY